MEWNEKLAAEYEESAMKIKGRIDELSEQINERRNRLRKRPNYNGGMDKETEKLVMRRMELRKMRGDTIYTARILERYYVDK